MQPSGILIVDDLPEMILVIKKSLETSGENFIIKTASNGKEALEILHTFSPHLIITDWEMPEMKGTELVIEVRKKPEFLNTPIIILTGMMTQSHDLKTAFECGASDFLKKPFDKTELIARVKYMIQSSVYLKEILESKKRELTSSALRIAQMNEMNNKILDDLDSLYSYLNQQGRNEIKKIISKYKVDTLGSSWKEFEMRFESVYEDFYQVLAIRFPELTATDKKICAFLRMGLNSKEIAALTFQDSKSVDMARYRLRKKLEIQSNENLTDYLNRL